MAVGVLTKDQKAYVDRCMAHWAAVYAGPVGIPCVLGRLGEATHYDSTAVVLEDSEARQANMALRSLPSNERMAIKERYERPDSTDIQSSKALGISDRTYRRWVESGMYMIFMFISSGQGLD